MNTITILTKEKINKIKFIKEMSLKDYILDTQDILYRVRRGASYNYELICLHNFLERLNNIKNINDIQVFHNKLQLINNLIERFNINEYNKELFDGYYYDYIKNNLKTIDDIIVLIDKILNYAYYNKFDKYVEYLCLKIHVIQYIINNYKLEYHQDFFDKLNIINYKNIFAHIELLTSDINDDWFRMEIVDEYIEDYIGDYYDCNFKGYYYEKYDTDPNNYIIKFKMYSDDHTIKKKFLIKKEELNNIQSTDLYNKIKQYCYNYLLDAI